MGVGLFKGYGGRLLKRRHAAVADAGMCGGDVLDQGGRPDEPADAPAGAVEVLPAAADGESESGDFWRERGHAREFGVVEAIVDFVAEYEDVVFHAEISNRLELVAGEDFADGIVRRVEDDHASTWRDGCFELGEVECPGGGGEGFGGAIGWRVERHVDYFPAWHFDVGDVSKRMLSRKDNTVWVLTGRRTVRTQWPHRRVRERP